jgi:hypothetical protein
MIALVNLRFSAGIVGAEHLLGPPDPPAIKWSAFLVQVSGELTLSRVLAWTLDMRSSRPMVPIAIAHRFSSDELYLLDSLARLGVRYNAVFDTGDLTADLLAALAVLRDASVEREILQAWLARWRSAARSLEPILPQIIAHGVRGGRAKSLEVVDRAGRRLSESTLKRRLRKAGLPTTGQLLRDARLTGARLREARNVNPMVASLAAGYTSHRGRREAQRRTP